MNRTIAAAVLVVLASGPAGAATSCDAVKADIAAKLDGKGVKGYELSVIGKDEKTDGKVVGSCEGGAKAIVYKRGS